jgi:hypothetical protein
VKSAAVWSDWRTKPSFHKRKSTINRASTTPIAARRVVAMRRWSNAAQAITPMTIAASRTSW